MRGLGCMRLSTAPDRDDARGVAVVRAALAAGIELLDTADAYAHDDRDAGHNERLIAEAAPGTHVAIVTKGGLVRPDGTWHPDGRAKHLADAARASRDRLGRIDLYILHAVDPKTPLATSVRALAKLREAGVVRGIGVGNVTLHQLEAAIAIAPIDAIEVELSPGKLDAVHGGLVAACGARGIRLIAHRPLGGPRGAAKLARDPVLRAIAARLGVTPAEIALAWLRSLSPMIATIPGATRVDTATSCARDVALDDEARAALAAHFLDDGRAATPARGEVVMLVGMPGAGKSTATADYVARGYDVLNRDTRGGSIAELARELDRRLAAGGERVVLDNTYGTRGTRAPAIRIARRHGRAIRGVVLMTSLEDAQHNAAARELVAPKQLLPGAQFRYLRTYEPPRLDEGFDARRARVHAPSRAGRPSRADRRARRRHLARPPGVGVRDRRRARDPRAPRRVARARLRDRGHDLATGRRRSGGARRAPVTARRTDRDRRVRASGRAADVLVSQAAARPRPAARARARARPRAIAPRRRTPRRSRLRAAPGRPFRCMAGRATRAGMKHLVQVGAARTRAARS